MELPKRPSRIHQNSALRKNAVVTTLIEDYENFFDDLAVELEKLFDDALWKTDSKYKPRFTTHIVNAQIMDLKAKVLEAIR